MAAQGWACSCMRRLLVVVAFLLACCPPVLGRNASTQAVTACNDRLSGPSDVIGSALGLECGALCREETYAALISLYSILGPSHSDTGWTTTPGAKWGDCRACSVGNRTLGAATFRPPSPTDVRLPSYCCWEGVVCCGEFHALASSSDLYDAALAAIDASPSLSPALKAAAKTYLQGLQSPTCTPYSVTGLEFSQFGLNATFSDTVPDLSTLHDLGLTTIEWQTNELTGSLPDELGLLTNLSVLNLGNNNLTGTVPPSIGGLNNLTELNLEFNFLRGTLDQVLCQQINKLQALWMRGNNLTGTLNLTNCIQLRLVDLQDNNFTGPLPVSEANSQLNILRMANNYFGGPFPEAIYYMRYLTMLDLTNNSFTGNLSSKISNNGYMLTLLLGGNSLTGSIPEELTYLTAITRLDLTQNNFSGMLPDMSGLLGLQELYVGGNNIVGTIPTSLGDLPYLQYVDVSYTLMSCCDNASTAPHSFDAAAAILAYSDPFLQFAPSSPPVVSAGITWAPGAVDYTYGGLRCNNLQRNPSVLPHTKVLQPANVSTQSWTVSPEYFWFQNCQCESGYTIEWHDSNSVFTDCSPGNLPGNLTGVCLQGFQYPMCVPQSTLLRTLLVSILIPLFVIVLSVVSYLICCRRVTKIYRTFFMVMKRYKGMPRRGPVSVVVTDIEGYSNLMKEHPELMLKALSMHNSVIRKAKFTNIGYTLEQEGDSYLLAFHEPYDAVSFCVQAQQALMKADWPKGLPGVSMTAKKSSSGKHRRHNQNQSEGAPSAFFSIRNDSRKHMKQASVKPDAVEGFALLQGVEEQAGSGSSNPAMDEYTTSRPSHNRLVDWLRTGSAGAGERQLFRGLRVRMGVATGEIKEGHELRNSWVFEQAKVVSDAANGGQILMDAPTFKGIKDSLHQLGATDANGLNYRKLTSKKSLLDGLCFRVPQEQDEALILDMGEYHLSMEQQRQVRLSSQLQQPDGLQQGLPSPNMPSPRPVPRTSTLPYACGGEEEVPEPGTPASSQRGGMDVLRIYQILPPPLVRRAKVFGNRLALKDDVTCSDMPYFDAPGAKEAPLTASRTALEIITDLAQSDPGSAPAGACTPAAGPGQPTLSPATTYAASMLPPAGPAQLLAGPQAIPDVTMVFATVENYKLFFKRKNQQSSSMQRILSALVKEALRHVRGGYLCREQQNPPKFMVAFTTPQAALEWCLLVQEASMYLRWPLGVLLHKAFKEEYNAQGQLVFRGPRLKMGICEGVPNTIMPDHLGRADYHGASINQAARYMDAAAHGGQIICELQLVKKVLETWGKTHSDTPQLGAADGAVEGAGSLVSASKDVSTDVAPLLGTSILAAGDMASAPSGMDSTDADAADADSRRARPARQSNSSGGSAAAAPAAAGREDGPAAPARTPSPEASSSSTSTSRGAPCANGLRTISTPTPFAAGGPAAEGGTPHTQSTGTYTPSGHSTSFSSMMGSPLTHQAAEQAPLQPLATSRPGSPLRTGSSGARKRSGSSSKSSRRRPLSQLFKRSSRSSSTGSGTHHSALSSAGVVAAVTELLHGQPTHADLANAKSIPEEEAAAAAAAEAQHAASCPQYSLPDIPTAPTLLEVHWSGVFRFKGNAEPLDMVHVCTAALSGRAFPADPPKGKGQRIEERSGLVLAAHVPLPLLAKEYLASFPEAILRRPRNGMCTPPPTAAGLAASLRITSLPHSRAARSTSDSGGGGGGGGGADWDGGRGGAGKGAGAFARGVGMAPIRTMSSTTAGSYGGARPPPSRLGSNRPPQLQLQLQPLQRHQSSPSAQLQQQQQPGPVRSVHFIQHDGVVRAASEPALEPPDQRVAGAHAVDIADAGASVSPVRPSTPVGQTTKPYGDNMV